MSVERGYPFLQSILAQPVGKPSAAVCSAVAALKDLCELNDGAKDWRSGSQEGPSRFYGSGLNRNGGGRDSHRPSFRNSASSSNLSSVSIPRVTSFQSVGSSGGTPNARGAQTSPSTPGTGNTTPGSFSNGMRYQSRFRNSNQPVEEKILNHIILSKLNKFSETTYAEIRDFLYQILGSGEPDLAEMIRDFMSLVFRKAASEEIFCPLYAKLLSEISSRYSVILEEMNKLQENYMDIFDEVEETASVADYEKYVSQVRNKKYRLGYSQFLAELTTLEILDQKTLQNTCTKLVDLIAQYAKEEGEERKALVEEYCDCLLRMCKVFRKRSTLFFIQARSKLCQACGPSILAILAQKDDYPSLTSKARFHLMDAKDILGVQQNGSPRNA